MIPVSRECAPERTALTCRGTTRAGLRAGFGVVALHVGWRRRFHTVRRRAAPRPGEAGGRRSGIGSGSNVRAGTWGIRRRTGQQTRRVRASKHDRRRLRIAPGRAAPGCAPSKCRHEDSAVWTGILLVPKVPKFGARCLGFLLSGLTVSLTGYLPLFSVACARVMFNHGSRRRVTRVRVRARVSLSPFMCRSDLYIWIYYGRFA